MSDSDKKREASKQAGVSPDSFAETIPALPEPVGDSDDDGQGRTVIANQAETGDDSGGARNKPMKKS